MKIEPSKIKLVIVKDKKGNVLANLHDPIYELTTLADKKQIFTITQNE